MTLPQTHDLLLYAYDSTKTFWQTFELPWVKFWPDASMAGRELAANLIEEEFKELLASSSPVEHLDAFCDLLYVTVGAMHALGQKQDLLMLTSANSNFTGPLAETVKLLKEPGIPCMRRLDNCIPEACFGIVESAVITHPKFPQAFKAVHEANMTKLWSNPPENSQNFIVKVKQNKFLVRRKSDGKVIKSPEFKHPDLSQYL